MNTKVGTIGVSMNDKNNNLDFLVEVNLPCYSEDGRLIYYKTETRHFSQLDPFSQNRLLENISEEERKYNQKRE